jgi:hypothetical protein
VNKYYELYCVNEKKDLACNIEIRHAAIFFLKLATNFFCINYRPKRTDPREKWPVENLIIVKNHII